MSNLFKAFWVNVDENEKRIIDNNELAEQKIEKYHAEEAKRLMAERQENGEEVLYDGFEAGIDYGQIDSFDDGQNIIGAPAPEMDGGDGFSMDSDFSQGFPEDMEGDVQGGPMDFEQPSDGMLNPDENLMSEDDMDLGMDIGMDMEAPMEEQEVPETPQINLEDIQAQIDEQIRMAEEQAQQIVAAANEEADQIRAQAEEEGRNAGYEAGFAQGSQEAEQLKADAEAEIAEEKEKMQADFQQLVNSIEPDMVDTLTNIYEHVFNVDLRENKDIIMHLLKTTLSKMESGTDIILHISSDDYDLVTDEKPALEEAMGSPNSTLEIVEDPLLKENECILESEGGVFDCSLGVELSELARKLKLLSYDRNKR